MVQDIGKTTETQNASWNSITPRPSSSMESPPDISNGSLNPYALGIYIQTLREMNDTDDGTLC